MKSNIGKGWSLRENLGGAGVATGRIARYLPLLLLPMSVFLGGATWHVTFDPFGGPDQIYEVLTQTASGDTILVGPGTYTEHIPIDSKDLVIASTDGPNATVIDGAIAIPGRSGSLFYSTEGSTPHLTLAGFTLSHGGGAWRDGSRLVGGALAMWSIDRMGQLRVTDCRFEDNGLAASQVGYRQGGAVYLENIYGAGEFEACVFQRNSTVGSQGGHVYMRGGDCAFTDCQFMLVEGAATYGAGIFLEVGAMSFRGCLFDGRGASEDIDSNIYSWGRKLDVIGCRFVDGENHVARRVFLSGQGPGALWLQLTMVENQFIGGGPSVVDVDVATHGELTMTRNTFVRTRVEVNLAQGQPVSVTNNIFSERRCVIAVGAGGTISCNDVWATELEPLWGDFVLANNFSADPGFCGVEAGDLSIAAESPCAPEHSPTGCGLVGALDVACTQTPIRKLSWGELKALYR